MRNKVRDGQEKWLCAVLLTAKHHGGLLCKCLQRYALSTPQTPLLTVISSSLLVSSLSLSLLCFLSLIHSVRVMVWIIWPFVTVRANRLFGTNKYRNTHIYKSKGKQTFNKMQFRSLVMFSLLIHICKLNVCPLGRMNAPGFCHGSLTQPEFLI